jgi:hypothetical protein
MKRILLPFVLLSMRSPVFARLGETRDQAEARYGLPKKEKFPRIGPPLVEGAKELTFHYQGFRIRCAFLPATDGNEYVVREEYTCDGGTPMIKDFERDAILAAEQSGMKWSEKWLGEVSLNPLKMMQNQLGHVLMGQVWYRNDGAIAVHSLGGLSVRLDLPQAFKWEVQMKAAKEQADRAKVPKF